MTHKRRRQKSYVSDTNFNLPALNSGGTRTSNTFKPTEDEFLKLLNEAFLSKLSSIVHTNIQSKSKIQNLKNSEKSRLRVPPGTFETLDEQYGAYWTANTCKRLKVNGLALYKEYVQKEIDNLIKAAEVNQTTKKSNSASTSTSIQEEEIRSIVVPFGQIIRKDLPDGMRADIVKKINSAIVQYSDFACMFAFVVYQTMAKSVAGSGVSNNIIPNEFLEGSHIISLPSPPRTSDGDNKYSDDYKKLFTLTHLQVISTYNLGTSGVQKQTNLTHPLWTEIQDLLGLKSSDEVGTELAKIIDEAKLVNSVIKKCVVSQFSTNLANMYQDGIKFKKALDKLLLVLLKLHLQPIKERERQGQMKEERQDTAKDPYVKCLTRNKKRSLLNKYRKQLKKYEQKQKQNYIDRMHNKIEYIKSIKYKNLPKKSRNTSKFVDDGKESIEEVEVIRSETNISLQRLKHLKGKLKWLLYSKKDGLIQQQDIGIKNLSDREMYVCSILFSLILPYMPQKEVKDLIPAQLPLIVLANTVFEACDYKKFVIKLCPRPKPSKLLCIPLDNAMLYMLLSNFDNVKYSLICKERYPISSLPIASKKKDDVFGSVFNLHYVEEICHSRKLDFIHRILIRPGLVSCVINGSRLCKKIQIDAPKVIQKKNDQEEKIKLLDLEDKAADLNEQLRKKQKDFDLTQMDRDIKDIKRARNTMTDSGERDIAAVQVNNMKAKRWTEFKHMEMMRRELKKTRNEMYDLRHNQQIDSSDASSSTNANTTLVLDKAVFSGTDYGLKTMSVTVKISSEMYNMHLNLYNKFHPERTLPVKQVELQYSPLPEAHKLTSQAINYLCLKNKKSRKLEKRKKKTDLGIIVSKIEKKLSELSSQTNFTDEIDLKKYFIFYMQQREQLREFYHSKSMSRERRTVELKTTTVKDRVAASERKFVKGQSKTLIPHMAIGNAGTGVGSTIKGYDRRGGKWLRKLHQRYVPVFLTDEYMTSQLCVYCYFPISHPKSASGYRSIGTARCLNPECLSVKNGRSHNNRDVMSATAIGLSAMTKLYCGKSFPPFSRH